MPFRRLANVTLAVALSILAFAAFDQPVRAADDATVVAAAVAALEAAGMECTSGIGLTTCDIGADCTFFGLNGEDDCTPAGLPWGSGRIRTPDHPSGQFRQVDILVDYTTTNASDARAFLLPVIDVACPSTSDAAAGWITEDPQEIGDFKGDGCASWLTFSYAVDGSEKTYSLNLVLDPPDPTAATPVAATPFAPAPPAATLPLGSLAADMVTILEGSGMTCITSSERTHCVIGQECAFDADEVLVCGGTLYAPMTRGGFSTSATGEYGFWLEHRHTADTQDPSGMRAVFDEVVDLFCPTAAAAAVEWFAQPTSRSQYPGDGCAVFLDSRSELDPTSRTDHIYIASFVIDEAESSPSSAAAVASPSPVATDAGAAPVPGGEPSASDSGGAVVPPGGFVASITTPSNVTMDPTVALQSAVLALLILFLMPFPAQLFNSTVEEHRDEIRGWFAPLARGLRSAGSGIGAFWRSPVGIVAFLVVSALLYALLDPTFSLSVDGLITIVGILAGLVVVTALFSVPAVLWHGRRGDRPVIEAIPFTLLIAVVCVGISRLADFQPGYLYGLIIGLGFARTLDPSGEGRSGAAAAALMLVSALLAWVGLGWMVDAGIQGFVAVVIATILAAIMVAGLEGVAFGLLPIRSLPGEPIYAWNRIVWGGLIFVGLFAFMHVLINPQSGYLADSSRTPLFTMLALLIGFGVASVAFWGYFRFRPERVAT